MEGEQTTYNELVEFLRDKRKDVRLFAVEGIAQTSNSIEKYKFLRSTNVVRYLVRMVGEDDPQIARAVLSSLINFAADPTFLDQMLTNHVVSRIMDGLLDLENKVTELYAILLVNVTQQVRGVEKLLQKGDALEGYYVTKLVELFTTYDSQKEKEDSFSWIASVLNNVTQIREGRELITDRSRGLFVKLLPYIQHPNKIRQRGVLGVLRNCVFDASVHAWLLSDEIDILSKLLLPIRGPELYDEEDTNALPAPLRVPSKDKVRERDLESRAMIIDALLLLASTADSRKLMREKNIYVIIRDYDNEEENETISENLISLVTLLKGLDEDTKGAVSVNPLDVAKDHAAEVIQVSTKNLEFSATDDKPAQQNNTKANNSKSNPNPSSTGKNASKKDLDENGEEIEEI